MINLVYSNGKPVKRASHTGNFGIYDAWGGNAASITIMYLCVVFVVEMMMKSSDGYFGKLINFDVKVLTYFLQKQDESTIQDTLNSYL